MNCSETYLYRKIVKYITDYIPDYKYSSDDFCMYYNDGEERLEIWNLKNVPKPTMSEINAIDVNLFCCRDVCTCLEPIKVTDTMKIEAMDLRIKEIEKILRIF